MAMSAVSCDMYDDTALRDRIDGLEDRLSQLEEIVGSINTDIAALQSIVDALQKNVTVDDVEMLENGYIIYFSDGTTAEISNGKDGANAPSISVAQDEDGLWYWTIDGEWLIVDGSKVRAQGLDGEDGKDAVAPQVRINPDTKEWEISADGGVSWESTGVIAEGGAGSDMGSGIFRDVDYSGDSVIFTLQDGTQFTVPKSTGVVFEIEGINENTAENIIYGKSKSYRVRMSGVTEYMISKPDGWKAAMDMNDSILTVTAPVKENVYAETEGTVAVTVASEAEFKIVSFNVVASEYELRILTFEDEDYKGSGNYLGKKDWSSLIDNPQYGGPLLYGESGAGPTDYRWYDENNTFLAHEIPSNYGTTCYWGGGHAVSNYVESNLANGDYLHQLAVYNPDPTVSKGGHNGSANFCVHFGYIDGSSYNKTETLPSIYFKDGTARVIDHLYVMWNAYLANCVFNGNSLTEPLGEEGWIKLTATGYDAAGQKIGQELEFFIANAEGNIQDWTKWDLSSLGKVSKVEFNIGGTSDNGYGFSQPAYFCYDDVAVRFE